MASVLPRFEAMPLESQAGTKQSQGPGDLLAFNCNVFFGKVQTYLVGHVSDLSESNLKTTLW
jgi:hypothetical protein